MGYVGLPLAVGFAEAGIDVIGIDVDQAKITALRDGRSHIEDIPAERLGAVLERCTFTTRFVELHEAEAILVCVPTPLTRNREPDLGPLLNATRALAGVDRQGPARRARVDDVPRHDTGTSRSAPRGVRPARRRGLQPRLLARARRSRAAPTTRCATRRRSSAASPRPARTAPSSSTGASATTSSPSPPRRSPSSRSCSRTSSARSTSRSSTRWRCSPTAWASTSGRSSTPPPPSRSASRASTPAPGWAATASRSTPSTSRGRPASTTCRPSSSSSPARSTRRMPYFCLEKIERALNDEGKSVRGRDGAGRRHRLQGRHERHARVTGAEDRRPAGRSRGRGELPRSVRPRDRAARAAQRDRRRCASTRAISP